MRSAKLFHPEDTTDGAEDALSLPQRIKTLVDRLVRSMAIADRVKSLHTYRCQVCGELIELGSTVYAQAAHIRRLGTPHNGPDTEANVLCLCPNDHVRFDYGAHAYPLCSASGFCRRVISW